MNKNEILIKVFDIAKVDFVGSRFVGEELRKIVDSAISQNKKIILDFENISGITQSFGDEIIGIYIRAFGIDFIKSNLKVINANDKIKTILNAVANYSNKLRKTA